MPQKDSFMRSLLLTLALLGTCIGSAHADAYVYQCKMANGHINFTDKPCKGHEKELRENTVTNLPRTNSVLPRPTLEPVSYARRPFCDSINSSAINRHYKQRIEEIESALWRARDGKTKDGWIAYYERGRKAELQGCQ
jgi:hypothetical protein